MRAASFAIGLAAALSCAPAPDPASSVHDLRILGIRAEPAEVQVSLDPETQQPVLVDLVAALSQLELRALVVDPKGGGRPVHFAFTACPTADHLRCDGRAGAVSLGEGTVEGEEASWSLASHPDLLLQLAGLLQAAVEQDAFKGAFGVWPVVTLRASAGGEEAIGGKRLVLSARDPRFPDLRANQNPPEPRVTLNGAPLEAAAVAALVRGSKMEFDISAPDPGAKESYRILDYRGGSLSAMETFQYAWFTTAGNFSPESSGGTDFIGAAENPTGSAMIASSSAADGERLSIYVVVRDGRGGETWTKRTATLSGP
jgi:hypothetical protein